MRPRKRMTPSISTTGTQVLNCATSAGSSSILISCGRKPCCCKRAIASSQRWQPGREYTTTEGFDTTDIMRNKSFLKDRISGGCELPQILDHQGFLGDRLLVNYLPSCYLQ
jgi:hypothetical protein